MTNEDVSLLIAIRICLAYMDHLDDRHPFPNWPFVWHLTKRIMDLCVILLVAEDITDGVEIMILFFVVQILFYNHLFNPVSRGLLKEAWEGTKSSLRWATRGV